ncbi:Phosphoserine phosphatase SerB2 [Porphyridium purpureum]|uniref:phosphoserine phosphatase n=1 Tax=Porphyridium purpureum TaxID=35688 RepID=A0A5J4Z033_PORPP|nr:Phosphoserine phosphatase SerB2 [Porphyridium purpureum]|eukprot:POR4263..scf208_2
MDEQMCSAQDGDSPKTARAKPSRKPFLVTLSGRASSGVLPRLMEVVAEHGVELLDLQQITVRDLITVSASLGVQHDEASSTGFVKELLLAMHPLAIDVLFDVQHDSMHNARHVELEKAVITVIAPRCVPAKFLAQVTEILAQHKANILSINRTTERGDAFAGFEFIVAISVSDGVGSGDSLARVRSDLLRLEKLGDIAVQRHNLALRSKRLVVFDLSWTLVKGDAINLLCEAAKVPYTAGSELDARVAALKGKSEKETVDAALSRLEYTDGAVLLCAALKRLGYKLAVISSGAQVLADAAKYTLGLDYSYGNRLKLDSKRAFTGEIVEPVINAERKAELLNMLAMQEGIGLEQVVAIGDGPVSAQLLSSAGLSISFDQPTSTNADHVGGRISSKSLETVLYLMGVNGRDVYAIIDGESSK